MAAQGVSTFIADEITPGCDIASAIGRAIDICKLVVIMGTITYGTNTGAGFSTFDEMRCILDHDRGKAVLLVKLCDDFAVPL